MDGLVRLIRLASEEEPEAAPSTTQLQAQLMELREWATRDAERRRRGCPYAVGDLLTPRANGPYRGAGLPHVVTDVRTRLVPAAPQRTGGGTAPVDDIRVLLVRDGSVFAVWCDSTAFERWAEPE